MRFALSLMAVLLVAAMAATAQSDDKYSRETLRGLSGVEVSVESLDPEAEQGGLSKTTIQTDVELKLRLAGIRVLTRDELIAKPGKPVLYVRMSALLKESLYSYAITIDVQQMVRLERDPKQGTMLATTWSAGLIGSVGSAKLPQVRDSIKDVVDKFINAYLSVNPK